MALAGKLSEIGIQMGRVMADDAAYQGEIGPPDHLGQDHPAHPARRADDADLQCSGLGHGVRLRSATHIPFLSIGA
ncbi:hypothetical protein GCM10011367_24970 [Marinicauda pacifica]|nr:hypothetical protein GCM10011367_24970 [Marinicauda pacifica]